MELRVFMCVCVPETNTYATSAFFSMYLNGSQPCPQPVIIIMLEGKREWLDSAQRPSHSTRRRIEIPHAGFACKNKNNKRMADPCSTTVSFLPTHPPVLSICLGHCQGKARCFGVPNQPTNPRRN